MVNPTKQHYVPQCYLRAFADPKALKKEPFIWIFDRNGKNRRTDKIKNVLFSNDLYTLKFNGQKDYSIEESLSNLESRYAKVYREKIINKFPLNDEEHVVLCAFVCAMLQRTLRYKDNIERFINELVENVEMMERVHKAAPKTSKELKEIKNDIHKFTLLKSLPNITDVLIKMKVAFLCAEKGAYFITSDDPCNLFNPDLQWQKLYGPGLRQKNIQVTLPLSPEIMLCMSWSNLQGYIHWDKKRVDEANRMIAGHCYKYIVSHKNRTNKLWYSKYPLDIFFLYKVIKHRIKMLFHDLRHSYRGC